MSPATRAETTVVYIAGIVQGIALVTFPAAATIFTDPSEYDLSNTQYGALFLPQVVTAITGALLGARFSTRFGVKRVLLAGLVAGLLSMALLIISDPLSDEQTLAYALLLLATASLGAGFGLAVPALNTLTAAFHPGAADRSVLVLNALLGLGTVLAPVFVAVFVGLGFWLGLPIIAGALLIVLIAIGARLPLRVATPEPSADGAAAGIAPRFWGFAGIALLYGFCETVNGNWSQLDVTSELGGTTTQAALALTAFWAMVTLGRVFFAAIQSHFPSRRTYHLLPFVLAGAFVLIWQLPDDVPYFAVAAFGLAGLGCSALLPLTISFGQEELTSMTTAVAGGVIAFYQAGYGLAAFGVGALVDAGVELPSVYAFSAIIAFGMGVWSFALHAGEGRQAVNARRPS